MERFGTRPKFRTTNDKPCNFWNAQNWNPAQKCPALDKLCNNCGTKRHLARACRQIENSKQRIRNLTVDETTAIEEISDQSESSIYRIEKISRLIDKNKILTTTVKENGTEKSF